MTTPDPPPAPKPMYNRRWREYQPISPAARNYALHRGMTDEQIEEFQIGSEENWLAIPTFHGPNLMGIKLRNIYPSQKFRYRSVAGSKKGFWGYNDVINKSGTVFVCKGEIAAIVMRRFGFLSCAPTCGESAMVDRDPVVVADVIVVGDNDLPDVAQQTRYFAEQRAKALHARLIFPPPEFKDIDEWLLKDPHAPNEIWSMI